MTRSGERALLFAPGAGAPSSSEWMQGMKRRLEAHATVVCFDYPYKLAGRRTPDTQPVLVQAHREALERLRGEHAGPIVLAGKSMGGRIGCHVAAASEKPPAALVCFGYPLVGRGGKVRDEVLLELETPILFVQGTRDPLCPIDRLEALLPKLRAIHALHRVEDGDHSLRVAAAPLRARGGTQRQVDEGVVRAVAEFLDAHA